MRGLFSVVLAFAGLPVVFARTLNEDEDTMRTEDETSRIVQSLFRFPASQLGPEFDELVQLWNDEWLHAQQTSIRALSIIKPEHSGLSHAFYSVSTQAATLFRRQCYGATPTNSTKLNNLYRNFEKRRKKINFQYLHDISEEMSKLTF